MQIYPRVLCETHSVDYLDGQFMVSRHGGSFPGSWNKFRLGEFTLACFATLPCSEIRTVDGQLIGYCAGYHITEPGELLGILDNLPSPGNEENIEKFIAGLSGTFIVLIEVDNQPRLYLDPSGSSPVVFAPSEQVAAMSPSLIPYSDDTQDNVGLIDATGIPYTRARYPLGLTPRHGVFRVLPNHYLDLNNWRTVRHWPKGPWQKNPDTSAAVSEIAHILNRNIAAVFRKFPIQMSLTAGQDSRMLIACAREFADKISFFTEELPDDIGSLDCYVARRMARRFDLEHKVVRTEYSSVAEKEMWLYRTGCAVGDLRAIDSVPMFKKRDRSKAFMPGILGEVGRGLTWRRLRITPVASKADVDLRRLLHRAHVPEIDEFIEQIMLWRDALPGDNGRQLCELFALEQMWGCWRGASQPAYIGMAACEIWPFNNRRALELMLSLPGDYKEDERLSIDIINLRWPELLEFPINKVDLGYKISKFLSNPARALSRLISKFVK